MFSIFVAFITCFVSPKDFTNSPKVSELSSHEAGYEPLAVGDFIFNSMKEIVLNRKHKKRNNYRKYKALVDEDDFKRLSKFCWAVMKRSEEKMYAVRHLGNGKMIKMHQEIMGKPKEGMVIDHIDRDGLNNQKNNLRFCTHQQNCMNRTKNKNTLFKYFGVSYFKNGFSAAIKFNGRNIYLGRFRTADEAALAYNKAAKKYFGEFATLNIID